MADSTRIEDLKRRVQLDPASIAFAALAEEYRRAGQFEESISTCQAGLLRHPAYLSVRVTLGRSLIELGRYDEARAELEQVLKGAPENLAAIRGLAEIHHRRGEIPETVPETEMVAEEPPAPEPAPLEPPTAPAPPAPQRAPIPIRRVPVASLTPAESSEVAGSAEVDRSAAATVETSPAKPPVAVPAIEPERASVAVAPPAPPPTPPPTPIALKPRPIITREHPDAAALPALEALLARIVRARQSLVATATDR